MQVCATWHVGAGMFEGIVQLARASDSDKISRVVTFFHL